MKRRVLPELLIAYFVFEIVADPRQDSVSLWRRRFGAEADAS